MIILRDSMFSDSGAAEALGAGLGGAATSAGLGLGAAVAFNKYSNFDSMRRNAVKAGALADKLNRKATDREIAAPVEETFKNYGTKGEKRLERLMEWVKKNPKYASAAILGTIGLGSAGGAMAGHYVRKKTSKDKK